MSVLDLLDPELVGSNLLAILLSIAWAVSVLIALGVFADDVE